MAIVLFVEGDNIGQSASALDISQHGLKVQTAANLDPGQLVEVHLGNGSEGVFNAQVAWVGRVETDQAGRAGLKFLNSRGRKKLPTD